MNAGLIFIPKYVKQDSDLAYGEKVTHENYNEKLNLNTTQGDYNTEVLFKLLSKIDKEETYHIPYLDKDVEDINNTIETIQGDIEDIITDTEGIHEDIDNIEQTISDIERGTVNVQHAIEADRISSGVTAGPNKYYGTNENSELGFITLPEFIYAEDMESSTGVDGVYYIPALNSVTESMLSSEVRLKLNREAIVDYEYLDNIPSINDVVLTGNKSLSDLGIQPVGNYVTGPYLSNILSDYYTITAAQAWVNAQLSSYATVAALQSTTNTADSAASTANSALSRANSCARVGVNQYVSSPQNGDIYFAV